MRDAIAFSVSWVSAGFLGYKSESCAQSFKISLFWRSASVTKNEYCFVSCIIVLMKIFKLPLTTGELMCELGW